MKEARFALKQSFPIMVAYVFLGIAYGILMGEQGYAFYWAIISAVFIYAGSMQIVMVPLLSQGAPLYSLAIMAFFINARHIFYGIGFIDKFRKMGKRYPYMVFSLTDETYSVLCSVKYEEGLDENKASFLISLFNHSYWIIGCTLGALVGQYLPFDTTGIDFSATAFFLVVVVNQFRQYKSKVPMLIGLASALIFLFILGPESFLIPALVVSLIALLILKDKIRLKEELAK